jgi:adenosylcobinamide amidohydrolase
MRYVPPTMTLGTPVVESPAAAVAAVVWRSPVPVLAVSSAPVGGGLGVRRWVVNVQVPIDYSRCDLDVHVGEVAGALGLDGDGVGFLTGADVRRLTYAFDGGVSAASTVGVRKPTWAASPQGAVEPGVGTINTVVWVPARLSESALIAAAGTLTEAKVQALQHLKVDGTGTASDAMAVLCPVDGDAEPFGGPRSRWGSRIARAVWRTVVDGGRR